MTDHLPSADMGGYSGSSTYYGMMKGATPQAADATTSAALDSATFAGKNYIQSASPDGGNFVDKAYSGQTALDAMAARTADAGQPTHFELAKNPLANGDSVAKFDCAETAPKTITCQYKGPRPI